MKSILIAVSIFFSATIAQAKEGASGFYIEPFIGYEATGKGTFKFKDPTLVGIFGNEQDFKSTGPNYGLRLGWSFGSFIVAAEGHVSDLSGKYSEIEAEADIGTLNSGIYLGFQTELGLRAYATYLANIKGGENKDVANNVEATGSGYKVGVGYLYGYAAFNLEYIKREIKINSGSTELYLIDYSSIGASISFPFVL
jgi:hypothetical protein